MGLEYSPESLNVMSILLDHPFGTVIELDSGPYPTPLGNTSHIIKSGVKTLLSPESLIKSITSFFPTGISITKIRSPLRVSMIVTVFGDSSVDCQVAALSGPLKNGFPPGTYI